MMYQLYETVHNFWLEFRWRFWDQYRAKTMVRSGYIQGSVDDAIHMHMMASSHDDALLAVNMEALLNEVGCFYEGPGD